MNQKLINIAKQYNWKFPNENISNLFELIFNDIENDLKQQKELPFVYAIFWDIVKEKKLNVDEFIFNENVRKCKLIIEKEFQRNWEVANSKQKQILIDVQYRIKLQTYLLIMKNKNFSKNISDQNIKKYVKKIFYIIVKSPLKFPIDNYHNLRTWSKSNNNKLKLTENNQIYDKILKYYVILSVLFTLLHLKYFSWLIKNMFNFGGLNVLLNSYSRHKFGWEIIIESIYLVILFILIILILISRYKFNKNFTKFEKKYLYKNHFLTDILNYFVLFALLYDHVFLGGHLMIVVIFFWFMLKQGKQTFWENNNKNYWILINLKILTCKDLDFWIK